MTEVVTVVAAVIALATLVLAYLTYRRQHRRTQLEYVVTTRTNVLGNPRLRDLEVRYQGRTLEDPALTVVRIVSTGDQPMPAASFESDLTIDFAGTQEVVSAAWSG